MKKLMTLLSAAAAAFGLQAADTGTSFEGMEPGNLDITSSTGELVAETSGYWVTNGNETASLTVTYGTSVGRNSERTIPQFAEADQDYYLSIKTPFGNPVVRRVKNSAAVQPIGDGFYFDSQVKFTAFDEDPMDTAVTNDFDGAKIAVWAREVYGDENDPERVTGTNLWIRAGYLGSEPVSYNCGGLPNPAAWHRLTIKAIRNIYASGDDVPGFVVYIDNQPVYTIDETTKGIVANNLNEAYTQLNSRGGLYPSMVQGDAGAVTSIASVSFDGQGEVDDIVFTETAPDFAKDAEYVHINWTPADIESLTIAENVLNSDEIAAGSYAVTYEDNLVVNVSVSYAEGKVGGAWSTTGSATTVPGESFTFTASDGAGTIVAANAVASFNGTSYATLAEAVAEANLVASPTLPAPVLKLFGTTSTDAISIETDGEEVIIEIDLNGHTVGAISALTPLRIVDSVGGGVVAGNVYFDVYGSIAAGTYNANVRFGDEGAITGGRFLASANTASALNPFAPQGKEFVEGTGDDTGYLVLGNEAVKYTIKFISGEGSTTNEYEIAAGAAVNAPTAAEVVGKEFSAWDPAVVTPAAGDATYTAVYTYTQYTITYKNADGTAFTSWAQNYAAPNSFTIERAVTLPVADDVELGAVGVSFESWTNAAGTVVASTEGLTANLEVFAKLVSGGSGGWVADPAQIDQGKTAAQQYPALAKSPLAGTDAKALTTWAQSQTDSVSIADVANAAKDSAIYDAYLLNCDVDDVEDARAAFNPTFTFVAGEVVVNDPAGEFNGTLIKRAKADLGDDWTVNPESDDDYNFFQYELVP